METNMCFLKGGTHSLCAFGKLPKATFSFVTSICTSVRPSAWTTRLPLDRNYDFFFNNFALLTMSTCARNMYRLEINLL